MENEQLAKGTPMDMFGFRRMTRKGEDLLKSITPRATDRAALVLIEATGAPEYDRAMMRFIVGFALGEADALRRAALALSDPRAKGRERDVVLAMADGLDIEDALRGASRTPPAPLEPDQGNVVKFRR